MEKILETVSDFAKVYIDYVIIFSSSWEEHLSQLRKVFNCLQAHSLTIRKSKCCFDRKYINYLGHLVGSGRVAIPSHHMSALRDCPIPKTKLTLRSLLGSFSYYRKFILSFASYSALLTPSTSSKAPNVIQWSGEMLKALEGLKVSLSKSIPLYIHPPTDNFILYCDACGTGVGAVIHAIRDNSEVPIAFFSRQLSRAERKYSITELEILAIITAISHFELYLYGSSFDVVTDHKACMSLLISQVLNRRLRRMALKLQGSGANIIHHPGKQNANADGLSRLYNDVDLDVSTSSSPSSSKHTWPSSTPSGPSCSKGVKDNHPCSLEVNLHLRGDVG